MQHENLQLRVSNDRLVKPGAIASPLLSSGDLIGQSWAPLQDAKDYDRVVDILFVNRVSINIAIFAVMTEGLIMAPIFNKASLRCSDTFCKWHIDKQCF